MPRQKKRTLFLPCYKTMIWQFLNQPYFFHGCKKSVTLSKPQEFLSVFKALRVVRKAFKLNLLFVSMYNPLIL